MIARCVIAAESRKNTRAGETGNAPAGGTGGRHIILTSHFKHATQNIAVTTVSEKAKTSSTRTRYSGYAEIFAGDTRMYARARTRAKPVAYRVVTLARPDVCPINRNLRLEFARER